MNDARPPRTSAQLRRAAEAERRRLLKSRDALLARSHQIRAQLDNVGTSLATVDQRPAALDTPDRPLRAHLPALDHEAYRAAGWGLPGPEWSPTLRAGGWGAWSPQPARRISYDRFLG
jgi:hypothetical protein